MESKQHSARIQTFKPRRGRYSTQMLHGLAHGRHQLNVAQLHDPSALFGQSPVILEIGFGLGESTMAQAVAFPDHMIVGIEVHTPGVGRLLAELDERGIENVRVLEGDALDLLHEVLPTASLAGIRIFFPDPWPKARHHKRRILTPGNLDAMARVLDANGFLHFATDWLEYGEAARAHLAEHPAFELLAPERQPAIASESTRPLTKFEARGKAAGRSITDLVALRR